MASLMQSSAVPSTIRHQLSSITSTISSSSSFGSIRAFSLLCGSQRRTQTYPQKNKHIYLSVSSPKSLPSIQQSRTFLAKLARKFPATAHTTPPTNPADVEVGQAQIPPLQLTNLPYFVRRTPSNQLPVYLETKAGGTKKLTKIQKTEGDLEALRSDLARTLGLETGDPRAKKSPEVTINPTNGHIVVKGWRKPEIQQFLTERNF
ncbi:mitochondrial large subunit ribosomal protein-domain-containing protein [Talaromyces proteolyticus]|uniref:Large ribosomal subunit protein mL49 n=1 Tax=Talaromyces proteolyticus TaxID=1131652 RepID=A0AAD4KKY8_9EURO|nr:mitochondrial large subunit ribosomal protein-domain-containing protein [Talaromyces proteolyticus]KAH8692652.1 mitochondrial large subunit ribosomal protein-domain-containing protein [Talaromyces proteolyticus]